MNVWLKIHQEEEPSLRFGFKTEVHWFSLREIQAPLGPLLSRAKGHARVSPKRSGQESKYCSPVNFVVIRRFDGKENTGVGGCTFAEVNNRPPLLEWERNVTRFSFRFSLVCWWLDNSGVEWQRGGWRSLNKGDSCRKCDKFFFQAKTQFL